jgi:hypothetical protein
MLDYKATTLYSDDELSKNSHLTFRETWYISLFTDQFFLAGDLSFKRFSSVGSKDSFL